MTTYHFVPGLLQCNQNSCNLLISFSDKTYFIYVSKTTKIVEVRFIRRGS